MEETRIITVRKSAMNAEGQYDFQKICYPRTGFLNCTLQEEKEEVHITYQITKRISFEQIRKEKKEVRLAILMDLAKLYQEGRIFQFSVAPENLYYDLHHRVYVMQRDVFERGCSFDEKEFISGYKALIGYSLQKKYSFQNYKEGGEALLKKNGSLKQFYEVSNVSEIADLLEQKYHQILQEQESKKVLVSKSWFEKSRAWLIILLLGLMGTGGYLGYQMLYLNPYQKAVIAAADAFLDSRYIETVDALQKISLKRLALPQKYVLAVSYVKSENLTEEQKKNILAGLSLTSSEKLLEYWIHMGRLDVSEAQNIAIQLSDDQLLVYAYLKEKMLLETNTQMSGEEKINALNAINSKIKPLADKFDIDESTK